MECAGQCLLTPSCSAFQSSDSYCRLLDSTYLYRDKTDTTGTPIYMVESKSAMQGKNLLGMNSNFMFMYCNVFSITVATTWTLWNSWSGCNQICNTGSRYRDRQCPGSVPLGDINRPPKTAQYGGQRDCANNPRHTENCNTFYCNRKLK